MLRCPLHSPGYHTTLTGGMTHPTRESLTYAAALLDTGEEELRQRAQGILRRILALQDQDPSSKTYGIWSWFAEEPLTQMSPPDWNWADFCGTQLLEVALNHSGEVEPEILAADLSLLDHPYGPWLVRLWIWWEDASVGQRGSGKEA